EREGLRSDPPRLAGAHDSRGPSRPRPARRPRGCGPRRGGGGDAGAAARAPRRACAARSRRAAAPIIRVSPVCCVLPALRRTNPFIALMPSGRILSLTSSVPRWAGDSCAPFVLHLARDLQDLGWEVDVLAPHAPGAATSEKLEGVRIDRFRYLWPSSLETV